MERLIQNWMSTLACDKPWDEGSPPSCLGTLEMAYQEADLRAELQGVSSVSSGESFWQ